MKTSLIIVTFLFCIRTTAQEKIPFIDYDSIYQKVNKASEIGDNALALELLDKINKNDSTYYAALVSKSFYLLNLKRYDEAIIVTDEGLNSKFTVEHSSFYINKSVAYLNLAKHQEALETCNKGLEFFPLNKILLYNKGVSLEGLGNISEAAAIYQQVITVDPFYRKPYLQLGNICFKQQLITQALMCFNMYLLIEPDGQNAFEILKSLDNTLKAKNINLKNPDIKISEDDESFEEIDIIINSKIALNEQYKTGNEINITLTKQNHALLESLKSFNGNGGFWSKNFVKYYQWINQNNFFDVFSYTVAYSIENESYKKVVTKNEKEIIEFIGLSRQKWSELVQNNVEENQGGTKNITYFFKNGYVNGTGELKGTEFIGPWKLYDQKGRFTGKLEFDSEGNRNGNSEWYYNKNELRETAQHSKGKLNGDNVYYHENGKHNIISKYKNDLLEGEYLVYNNKGALEQKKTFRNGKLNGIYTTYHSTGEDMILSNVDYKDGIVYGNYRELYPTGDISTQVTMTDGKSNGRETQYHLNGKISLEVINKDGLLDGYYKKYYSNGNPMEVGQCTKGVYVGKWQTFYSVGTLESEFTYNEKGEIEGDHRNYDIDGKLHYVFEYRNGEIIAYKYYNKKSEVIGENRKKGGEFEYKGFSPQGKIIIEGLYDIKGGKKGVWKYYSSHGKLTSEGFYIDNKLQGEYKTYYPNLSLESISNYKNDTLHGYYASYHKNGQLQRQGWYKDDMAHGEWKGYSYDGTVVSSNFYNKGFFHGEQVNYNSKGIKTNLIVYNYGSEVKEVFFNQEGKIRHTVNYENGNKNYKIEYKHYNDKPSMVIDFVNGVKQGLYIYNDYYGRKRTIGQYLNGKMHGEWIWYHPNGNVETKANYLYGELNGPNVDYYEDGTIENEYFYELGKLQNEVISYYENGSIRTKSQFFDDKVHGKRESFSTEGKLELVRFYEHGRLLGYSYLDENSNEIPMIPLENETGKIIAYYDNKNVSREMEYENGELVNNYKVFSYSGQLEEDKNYRIGEFDGNYVEYYSNGSIKKVRTYNIGVINGISKEYYKNGNLKKEVTYLQDNKEGISKEYNENGLLIIEENYFNGEIISTKAY